MSRLAHASREALSDGGALAERVEGFVTRPAQQRLTAAVAEAIDRMVALHRAAVVIVDGDGRLVGIFTERDVLIRVLGQGRDPATTRLGSVMTERPEALSAHDRVCFAVNRMSTAGFRTLPLVDAEQETQIGGVGLQQGHPPKVVGAVAGNHAQPGVQEVVRLVEEGAVVGGEHLHRLRDLVIQRAAVLVM